MTKRSPKAHINIMLKSLTPVLLLLAFVSCSTSSQLQRGKVVPKDFYSKFTFETAKSIILIPATFEGELKNYFFDSGSEVTGIQRDSIRGETVLVRGATNRQVESGTEILASFRIGEVDFVNTFATNSDMVGLKEQIPNFGGILGRSIINKANWLIDYPNRTIEIASRKLIDEADFINIPVDPKADAHYTTLTIDGESYRSIIDLGSTSVVNVPIDSELGKTLLERYPSETRTRDRYTVGGLQKVEEKHLTLPLMKVGEKSFQKVAVVLNQSSQIRLGMSFFKDYIIYLDNDKHRFWIQ